MTLIGADIHMAIDMDIDMYKHVDVRTHDDRHGRGVDATINIDMLSQTSQTYWDSNR